VELYLQTHRHLPPLFEGVPADQSRRSLVLDEPQHAELEVVGNPVGRDDPDRIQPIHMIFFIILYPSYIAN
jgi:hypothetical protein